MLGERYGFRVESLIDATRHDIISAMARKRAELTQHDNLLTWISHLKVFSRLSLALFDTVGKRLQKQRRWQRG